jgi:hypothetical protein
LTPLITKARGRSFVVSRIALILGSGIVSLALTGCPSLSTMQTPRTVPQGQVRFGLGFEAVGIKTAARTDSSGTTTPSQSVTFPQLELTLRYGVTDNLDVGGKLYLIGAEAGFKYQFLRGPLDVAVAPAASYISFGSSSGSSSSSISATYLHLPVLFGINLNDNVAISFGPKLLYTIASVSAGDTSDRASAATSGLWLGGYVSLPLKVGSAFWIAPELNVYRPLKEDVLVYQGGLALLFGGADHPPAPPPPPGWGPPPPGYPPPPPPPGYQPPPPPPPSP